MYFHEKKGGASASKSKSKSKNTPSKPPSKAAPKLAVVALVAALSSMVAPVDGCLEFAANSGAGRRLISRKLWRCRVSGGMPLNHISELQVEP